jgi:hypothetical protein
LGGPGVKNINYSYRIPCIHSCYRPSCPCSCRLEYRRKLEFSQYALHAPFNTKLLVNWGGKGGAINQSIQLNSIQFIHSVSQSSRSSRERMNELTNKLIIIIITYAYTNSRNHLRRSSRLIIIMR